MKDEWFFLSGWNFFGDVFNKFFKDRIFMFESVNFRSKDCFFGV